MGFSLNSKSNILIWLSLAAVLLSLFQNCTGANFGGSNPVEYQATGDGHEGKLSIPIDYVRTQDSFYDEESFPLHGTALQLALQSKPTLFKFCRSQNLALGEGVDLVVAKEKSLWPTPLETHDLGSSLPTQSNMTRFSTATAWNSAGQIQNYNAHEPRFQRNPNTGEESLLIEGYSKNYFSDSMDFAAGSWTPTGLSPVLHSSMNGPMNTNRVTLLSENATPNIERSIGSIVWLNTGNDVTLSIYTKSGTPGRNLGLRMKNLQGDEFRCLFDPTSETISAQSSSSEPFECRFEKYPNGWLRPSLTFNSGSLPSNTSTAYIELLDSQQSQLYSPSGHPGVIVWGAQLEEQLQATSFIPSAGGPLERQSEVLRLRQGMVNHVDAKWSIDYFTKPGSTLRIDLKDTLFSTDSILLSEGQIGMNFDGISSSQNNINFSGDQLAFFELSNSKLSGFNGGELAGHRTMGRNQTLGELEVSLDRGQSFLKRVDVFPGENSEEILSIQSQEVSSPGTHLAVIALGRRNINSERVQTQPIEVQQESISNLESQAHDFMLEESGSQFLLKASLNDGTFIEETMNCD